MADTSTHPMVETRGLRKHFGTTRAVDNLSFKVHRGEVVGFLGPNGAGKTTTLRMLTGFLKPTAGQVLIDGIDVAAEPLAARQQLGYLPENAPLYADMMVIDFLNYVAELRQIPESRRAERLRTVADRCGLGDVLGKDIGQLSKGYRQRVGLAQALVHDPDLLLLDEPTSGLDPNQIVEIRQLIRDLGREKTILLSTHILPEVQATCSRIIIINDGMLVADDTPENLTENNAGAVVNVVVKGKNGTALSADTLRTLFASVPGVGTVSSREGEGQGTFGLALHAAGSTDPREAIFSAAVKNDLVLLSMSRERVSLEDTFRRLTRGEQPVLSGAEGGAHA